MTKTAVDYKLLWRHEASNMDSAMLPGQSISNDANLARLLVTALVRRYRPGARAP